MTIKLEEKTIELGGKTYVLRVNMSVLDRLQEASGGEIGSLLKRTPNDVMAATMAEMLNDWAEDQGWDEQWTEKKVKKLFSVGMLNILDISGMFFRALSPASQGTEAQKTKNKKPDEESGN